MEISLYFEPVDFEKIGFQSGEAKNRIGNLIEHPDEHFDEDHLGEFDAVIFGVKEGRRSVNNEGTADAPDQIRKYLYRLSAGKKNLKIGDLGNILAGNQVDDTYFAVKSTVHRLLKSNTIPIILGGGQDLTYAAYLGFEEYARVINLVGIDAKFDNSRTKDPPDSDSYLSKIIFRKPNFLFNFSNIGYQTYFIEPSELQLIDKLFFDAVRLGEVRNVIPETEPIIRNADFVSFDISSIRQSDAPGNGNASPNGFYGEEACQLLRYAGLSSKLSCLGIFEVNPRYDQRGQTAHLAAQMIWYFFDGLSHRISDYPGDDKSGFLKYMVNASGHDNEFVFYKSKATDRWWMQLPVSREKEKELFRHIMVPCSYGDYAKACNNEIPDRWWKAYQKLM